MKDELSDRQLHRNDVLSYLERRTGLAGWTLELPRGRGQESYVARAGNLKYFIKLKVDPLRHEMLAAAGIAPPIVDKDHLQDGTAIIVQSYVPGKNPGPQDFQRIPEQVADLLRRFHQHSGLLQMVEGDSRTDYKNLAHSAWQALRCRWNHYKGRIAGSDCDIGVCFDRLLEAMDQIRGSGSVACHNDICCDNWLLTPGGRLYLVDPELASIGDPASDLGPLLWWYYPPAMRDGVIAAYGFTPSEDLRLRLWVHLALHYLRICLPRTDGYDVFPSPLMGYRLKELSAVMSGRENPRGFR